MNGRSALDWIRMGNLDPLIGEDIKRWVFSILSEVKMVLFMRFSPNVKYPRSKATEPLQCFIDEIMAGVYSAHKFKILLNNPFRKRNWKLLFSYLSFGILAPYFLNEE